MKVRLDFVSNSSSSSFVLSGRNARRGLKLLKKVFDKCEIPFQVETNVNMHFYAKNKNVDKLWTALSDERPPRKAGEYTGRSDPDDVEWDYLDKSMSNWTLESLDDKTLRLVESVSFYVGDGQDDGVLPLKMLYMFLERNGCAPDASDSEQSFLETNCMEKFFAALAEGPENG